MECNGGRQQGIQSRIGEQGDSRGEPPLVRPSGTVRRRDPPDLAGYQSQAAAVERTTKQCCDRHVAVPAHFEHRCFLAPKRERGGKSGRASARVKHNVAITLRRFRLSKVNTELLR